MQEKKTKKDKQMFDKNICVTNPDTFFPKLFLYLCIHSCVITSVITMVKSLKYELYVSFMFPFLYKKCIFSRLPRCQSQIRRIYYGTNLDKTIHIWIQVGSLSREEHFHTMNIVTIRDFENKSGTRCKGWCFVNLF